MADTLQTVPPAAPSDAVVPGWDIRIVGHAVVDPRTLTPHPLNPKIHPVEQDQVVEASLRELGWLKALLVNRVTGHILDGHERQELAIRRGVTAVPVDYVELAEADEGTALRLLDPSAQLAKTQVERWAALHRAQTPQEPVLQAFFAQLARTYKVAAPEAPAAPWQGTWAEGRAAHEATVAAKAEALRQAWDVEVGQLWELGAHRVLCGDALDAAGVRRLVEGGAVDLVVTSPPYGVGKDYEAAAGVQAHRALLRRLGEGCQAVVTPGGLVVVNFADLWAQHAAAAWTGSGRACCYPMTQEYWQCWHEALGWDLYAQRIWVKRFANLRQPLWTYHTSLAHQQEWEHVWTWRLPGETAEQVYDWDVSVHAVWDSRQEYEAAGPWDFWSAGFPTCVPRWAVRAHSAPGAVVWEPFLGGGTTLLACEELGRRCLGMDQDPAALAVTLQRFYEGTGRRPQRVA
jgi:DNA methylase